jgi:putative acetyltransferase
VPRSENFNDHIAEPFTGANAARWSPFQSSALGPAWLRSALGLAMFVIRPALESDFGAVGRVFHDAIRQIARRDYTEEQVRAWSPGKLGATHWQRRTAKLEVKVAVLESVLAGFIGFSHRGHIDLLFVRPEFVRRGIATALLLEAERVLGQLNVGTAWTEASLTARAFFQTMGYSAVREQTVCCGGVELRNYRMEKVLTQSGSRED